MSILEKASNKQLITDMRANLSKIFKDEDIQNKLIDAILIDNASASMNIRIFNKEQIEANSQYKKLSFAYHPDRYNRKKIDVTTLTSEEKKSLTEFFKKFTTGEKVFVFENQESMDGFIKNTLTNLQTLKSKYDKYQEKSANNAKRKKSSAQAEEPIKTPKQLTAHTEASNTNKPSPKQIFQEARQKMDAVDQSFNSTIQYAKSFTKNTFDPQELNKRLQQADQKLESLATFVKQHNLDSQANTKDFAIFMNIGRQVMNKLKIYGNMLIKAANTVKSSVSSTVSTEIAKLSRETDKLYNDKFIPLYKDIAKKLDKWEVVKSAIKTFTPFMAQYGVKKPAEPQQKNHKNPKLPDL